MLVVLWRARSQSQRMRRQQNSNASNGNSVHPRGASMSPKLDSSFLMTPMHAAEWQNSGVSEKLLLALLWARPVIRGNIEPQRAIRCISIHLMMRCGDAGLCSYIQWHHNPI